MIKLYNTLSQKKDTFQPLESKKIGFFVCGPTVYDYAHLGHARTYIFFDSFVKYLRGKGYNVFYLQNITDIDDKIIKRAEEEKTSPLSLAEKFEEKYLQDTRSLGIDSITKYARATDHIQEIISQIERLLEKDFAYITDDGIYYDISKFNEYGKLSGRTTEQAEDGTSRIDESIKKRNKGDFCIWKFSENKNPEWETPWGKGRPGWHIEDTAISEKYLGMQYDIHGGARDLIFPHHEAEIALMESLSGKRPFVKYWMHTGFLTINGDKMSKSLGNFVTIRDFTKKHSPRALRFLVLKSHYRSPIDYNENYIFQVNQELERIDSFLYRVEEIAKKKNSEKTKDIIKKIKNKIERDLEEDFNTPLAISSLFVLINKVNTFLDSGNLSSSDAKEVIKLLKDLDRIFGFLIVPKKERFVQYISDENEELKALIAERENARKKKDFQKADEIRKKIEKKGYQIEDTIKGYKIKKK